MKYLNQSLSNTWFYLACLSIVPSYALADTAGEGSDMWTSYMEKNDLFIPHGNGTSGAYCDSSEVFVSFTPESTGYCIEKDERTALTWEEARQDCLASGKRLPEPAEFKYACKHPPTGLIHMTDNWEWASNYHILETFNSFSDSGVFSMVAGNGGCASEARGAIGLSTTSTESSYSYRCVR